MGSVTDSYMFFAAWFLTTTKGKSKDAPQSGLDFVNSLSLTVAVFSHHENAV